MRTLLAFLLFVLFTQSGVEPICFNIPVPTTQFSLGYGQSNSQALTVTPYQVQDDPNHPGYLRDGFYKLTFTVQNYFPTYPGYYDVQVLFGTQEFCETSGWAAGAVQQITLICPAPHYIVEYQALPSGGPVQGSNPFALTFFVPGWQILFNNIAFTYTPGPRAV